MRYLAPLALCALLVSAPVTHADSFTSWTAGADTGLENTYDGYIDSPAMNATVPPGLFSVTGWFVDSTAQGWSGADDVQVWLGTMDGGGKMLVDASVLQNRPDVAAAKGNPFWANAGFVGLVPADALGLGPQTLSVYAHTPGKGWWYKQVTVNVSQDVAPAPVAPPLTVASKPIVGIEKPKDGEIVLTNRPYEIVGWALDKNAKNGQGAASSGVDRVQVYIGDRDNGGTYLGDATLAYSDPLPAGLYGSQFASAGWRLTFQPTRFHVNTYLIYAYARSAVSGNEELAVRYFAIRDNP